MLIHDQPKLLLILTKINQIKCTRGKEYDVESSQGISVKMEPKSAMKRFWVF